MSQYIVGFLAKNMPILPENFIVVCELIVSSDDNHNVKTNPEFYKKWDEIKAEFDGKRINSVKIKIIRSIFNCHLHKRSYKDSILICGYEDYSTMDEYTGNAAYPAAYYKMVNKLCSDEFMIPDIHTLDDVPKLDKIPHYIHNKIDDILIATAM